MSALDAFARNMDELDEKESQDRHLRPSTVGLSGICAFPHRDWYRQHFAGARYSSKDDYGYRQDRKKARPLGGYEVF